MANFPFYRNLSSLAGRVLLVCMGLLVIPLILFSLLVAEKERRLQERDEQVELTLIGQGVVRLAQEWIALKEVNLDFLLHLLKESPNSEELLIRFAGDSTLFILQGGRYETSNDPELVGKESLLGNAKVQIAPLKPGLAPSLILLKNNVGLAVDAASWVGSLAKIDQGMHSFSLSLLGEKGQLIASSDVPRSTEIEKIFELPGVPFKFEVTLTPETARLSQSIGLFDSLIHFLFVLLFVGGGAAFWLTWRMARPLKHLHRVMDLVQQGDLKARYVSDRLGFEVNQIGGHFNQTVEALTEQRLAREVLARELEIGRTIQRNLFPKEMPQVPGIQVAAGFIPAKEVAGDFYDLFFTQNGQLFIAIADASDKGISACLYSLLLRSLLRAKVNSTKDLSTALFEANELFCQDTAESGNFATAWVGLYDPRQKQLTFCNAGHPPALLLRGGGIEELNHGVGALGVEDLLERPTSRTIQLQSGDLLLFVTDGVLEAQDVLGKFFGKKAMLSAIHDAQNKTPQETVDLLIQKIGQFSQGAEQSDDLTVLSVRID